MMLKAKRAITSDHTLLSDSETESDDQSKIHLAMITSSQPNVGVTTNAYQKDNNSTLKLKHIDSSSQTSTDAEMLAKAKEYQQKMKQLEIPYNIEKPDEPILYMNWKGVGRRLKQKYKQPLHYLTHVLLTQWDKWNAVDETTSFEEMMVPYDAESTVLGIEQVHRKFTCPEHLAKMWLLDPQYLDSVGDVV